MVDGGHLCPSPSSARDIWPAVVCSIIVAPALTAVGGRPTRRSVALVVLESDQPVQTVPVDDLPIGCAPWPSLQVIHDPATFGQTGEPVAQGRGSGSAKQGQHQAFGSDWRLVAGHVGAKQRDWPLDEVAVGDRIGRTVGPAELREGVQPNRTAEDVTVERQGLTSSGGEMDVGRQAGHGSNVMHRRPQPGTLLPAAGAAELGPPEVAVGYFQ